MKITEKRVEEALHFKSPLHPYTTITTSSGSVIYSSPKKTFTIASGDEDLARSIAEEIFNNNYPLSKAKQIAKQHGGRI